MTNFLNKALFRRTIDLYGIKVPRRFAKDINVFRKFLKDEKCLLTMPKLKPIINNDDYLLFLLQQDMGTAESVFLKFKDNVKSAFQTDLVINTEARKNVQLAEGISILSECSHEQVSLVPIRINVGYDNLTRDEVFKVIIPKECDNVSSFEVVGHIAHLNLRDDVLHLKHQIAQVILEKTNGIKTVVNKVGSIDNTFRFFNMEILAGEDNMVATVKEQDCLFSFDYSKVYWNSRLQYEHERLVKKLVNPGEYICDLFAGVGPFAIPLYKHRECHVYANDLNPESYNWLLHNASKNGPSKTLLNKRKKLKMPEDYDPSYLKTFNMDAKEFIKFAVDDLMKSGKTFDHFVMNLPGTSLEFLQYFRGSYVGIETEKMPVIHCYFFAKKESNDESLVECVENHLGSKIDQVKCIHNVRNVSASKDMFCVSFVLPKNVAYQE
jgi:tRNA (guanine37-N1)-methyltransferase